MVFLSSWIFCIVNSALSVYLRIKYRLLRLVTPALESAIKDRFKTMGVEINGENPWDIQVHQKDFYAQLATYNSLALGEAYIDKTITIEDISECAYRLTQSENGKTFSGTTILEYFNIQSKSRLAQDIKAHYDIGNDIFEATLCSSMLYSTGYFREACTLNEAQVAKMDLIARKMMLQPGMKILDIGCGWGGIAYHLAKNYGVYVVGITISNEQLKYAKDKFAHPNVELKFMDYRDLKPDFKFDGIISIGMFEHVGSGNYTTFFNLVKNLLKDDGLFLLQTTGVSDPDYPIWDPFIHKYVFPGLIVPRQYDIAKYVDGIFHIEDWHDIGYDLAKTIAAWNNNFEKAWPTLQSKYDDRFYRMWTFYLKISEGIFRSRKATDWQIVFTKHGMNGGYLSQR